VLDQLDTAIGFATVMLGVSLLVTTLTQVVLALLDTRGRNLRSGLKHLIENVAPSLKDHAANISDRIVKHRLICDSAVRRALWGRATAIKREELLPVLDQVLKSGAAGHLTELAAKERDDLLQWFDSAMTRTSQWFVMYSRWVTVALSVVVAVAMHLDALAVFRQLQHDRDTRARLVAMSNTLLEQSPGVIEQIDNVRKVYAEVLRELLSSDPQRFRAGAALDPAVAIASRADAFAWIKTTASSSENAAALEKAFNDRLNQRLNDDLQRALDRFNSTRSDLAATGLSIYPGEAHTIGELFDTRSHLWGILASVLLLSLGAPFWFNMLKNLSSLRTVVAQQASPAADAGAPQPAAAAVRSLPTPTMK
jgi:hypothetical protein